MRLLFLICILLQLQTINAQGYEDSIKDFQDHLNSEYSDPETSPLIENDLVNFKGHDFFPVNADYRLVAHFERTLDASSFFMKTTTDRLPAYDVYGVATFKIGDTEYKLNVYQSHSLRETEEYKNYLFLPFTDQTNGHETYSGGRFIDLEIPEGDTIVIDFNKAYNPYCAYNSKYSCPIPPKENDLPLDIRAGIKYHSVPGKTGMQP